MRRLLIFFFTFILLSLAQPSLAVVQWARQYAMPCTGCHAGFPRLNETGIRFRQLGYRFEANETPKPTVEQLIGPTWSPNILVSNATIAIQRRGVKIHLGGAITSSLAFLVQPTPGEKNNVNMAQVIATKGAFRVTAGRLYAWENGGGVGASDRVPTSNLPRMFATIAGVTVGGLGTGFRLDHTDRQANILSVFSTDLSGSGPHASSQGVSITRRYQPRGLNYAEIFVGSTHLSGGGSAQRWGATVSHTRETKDGTIRWLFLGGALYGSQASKRLGAGFLEADWLPFPRDLVLIRSDIEQGVTSGGIRHGLTLGAATQFSPQQRLELDWTPKGLSATTTPLTAKLRFFL